MSNITRCTAAATVDNCAQISRLIADYDAATKRYGELAEIEEYAKYAAKAELEKRPPVAIPLMTGTGETAKFTGNNANAIRKRIIGYHQSTRDMQSHFAEVEVNDAVRAILSAVDRSERTCLRALEEAVEAAMSVPASIAYQKAKQEADAACEAQTEAFLAMLSYYPTSAEAAAMKAAHLMTLSHIQDNYQEPYEVAAMIVGMAPPGTFAGDTVERQREADAALYRELGQPRAA